jgi:hypothetical protein
MHALIRSLPRESAFGAATVKSIARCVCVEISMEHDMSKHVDPLGKTASELQRFYVRVRTPEQWYAVMHECRAWFGRDWRTQPRVRRKLHPRFSLTSESLSVWFEVPDLRICTWIATKLALEVTTRAQDSAGK